MHHKNRELIVPETTHCPILLAPNTRIERPATDLINRFSVASINASGTHQEPRREPTGTASALPSRQLLRRPRTPRPKPTWWMSRPVELRSLHEIHFPILIGTKPGNQ